MKTWEIFIWMLISLSFGITLIVDNIWMGITLILLFIRLGIDAIIDWTNKENKK